MREDGVRIGVLSNSEGNFYMHEIAELLALGLQQGGIDAVQRDELSDPKERFDLRIFVAPHEFFYIGAGKKWLSAAGDRNTVLYNLEQMRTRGSAGRFRCCCTLRWCSTSTFNTLKSCGAPDAMWCRFCRAASSGRHTRNPIPTPRTSSC